MDTRHTNTAKTGDPKPNYPSIPVRIQAIYQDEDADTGRKEPAEMVDILRLTKEGKALIIGPDNKIAWVFACELKIHDRELFLDWLDNLLIK
jgi:hypothetical protein